MNKLLCLLAGLLGSGSLVLAAAAAALPGAAAARQEESPQARRSLVTDEELIRAAPRDTFRVLDEPKMMAAAEAEAAGIVRPDEPILGIALEGEARAYSLERLGSSELINDRVAGTPIAATW